MRRIGFELTQEGTARDWSRTRRTRAGWYTTATLSGHIP